MMPLSEPKKTTVWFREGPASLSATMRVRRYLEGKNDGEGKSVSKLTPSFRFDRRMFDRRRSSAR